LPERRVGTLGSARDFGDEPLRHDPPLAARDVRRRVEDRIREYGPIQPKLAADVRSESLEQHGEAGRELAACVSERRDLHVAVERQGELCPEVEVICIAHPEARRTLLEDDAPPEASAQSGPFSEAR
jgi:hypothetical protein